MHEHKLSNNSSSGRDSDGNAEGSDDDENRATPLTLKDPRKCASPPFDLACLGHYMLLPYLSNIYGRIPGMFYF
jgi:hypothetical protein